MKSFIIEILLLVILGILAFSTINPYWMPMGMQLVSISALIVLFAAFAVFVLREKGGDEREVSILHKSDRLAFLAGASVLLIALVYENVIRQMETPWILAALAVMVLTKISAYIYHQKK